jgi:hypothetical protein
VQRVGQLQKELTRSLNRSFFHGWDIYRHYTRTELLTAEFLLLQFQKVFELAGEECGTEYDETTACIECGAGASQVTSLRLNTRALPKRWDLARTIADEMVVSARFADLLRTSQVSGLELRPVGRCRKSALDDQWKQLVVTNVAAEIAPPTRIASGPFDDSERPEERCSRGHLLGLNLISELFVDIKDAGVSPEKHCVVATTQFVGVRRGLLRPRPLVVVSQATWRLMVAHRIKGFRVEVAHRSTRSPDQV